MIKALYEYAKAHPEVRKPEGYDEWHLDLVVVVSPEGHISYIEEVEPKKKFCIPCSAGQRNDNPLMRKALVFMEGGSKLESLVDEVESCFQAEPSAEPVYLLLKNYSDELSDMIRNICSIGKTGNSDNSFSEKSNVGFGIEDSYGNTQYLWDIPGVKKWRRDQYLMYGFSDRDCLDIVTGEVCRPLRLLKATPVICAGGGTMGSNLISFDKDAFRSYGYVSGANMPVSENTISAVIDAYNYLAHRAVKLDNLRVLYWCSGVNEETASFLDEFIGFQFDDALVQKNMDPEDMSKRLGDFLLKPLSGSGYGDLQDGMYHVITAQGDAGRISVLSYEQGSLSMLQSRYQKWHDSMQVISYSGKGFLKQRSAKGLLRAALSLSELNSKDEYKRVRPYLVKVVSSCMNGTPFPEPLLASAVKAFQSFFYKDDDIGRHGNIVQLIHIYFAYQKGKEEFCMPEVNLECKDTPYLCGRLFAVHEWFYGKVTKGSRVMTERFPACCRKPMSQISKMQMLCAHRFPKSYVKDRIFFESEAGDIMKCVSGFPQSLNLTEQAMFILGYWHEHARISQCEPAWAVQKKTADAVVEEEEEAGE